MSSRSSSISHPPSVAGVTANKRLSHSPHEVRLIGGIWKRTKLQVPDLPNLRPTPNRVRETLFNWLGQDLTGLRCLDAFAGTGALGLEAASRGAREVCLLEQHPALVSALHRTVERLSAHAQIKIQKGDALALMQTMPAQRWDVIFLDPPFLEGQNETTYHDALSYARQCISDTGWLHLESPRPWHQEEVASLGFSIWRAGKAGAVHHHLLQATERA
jgi:16S rRNA (guanine(966)-N(2))-methyltransferase RsmD